MYIITVLVNFSSPFSVVGLRFCWRTRPPIQLNAFAQAFEAQEGRIP